MKRLHPIMFAGTGSDVGKSIIATAFCRIFRQDGYNPAPFKAQNMALNSFATPDGFEIGRAQAVNAAFDRLAAKYNPIVMEGAGSIAEINLRETDLVNMPMAKHAKADVILVGDIDRGGVFASVYGSLMLLEPDERKLVKGIIINKFRGDIRLFEPGVKMLEQLCGIPVLGVLPYYKDIHIEEEDSVSLASKSLKAEQGMINIAVVLLRHISNFTDFNVLEREPRVHLFYSNNPDELSKADIIILPGSKSTIDDMHELWRNGAAQAILKAHRNGSSVLGICGGYQMMGQRILDPHHVEGDVEMLPGLGLLPTITEMGTEKVTRQTKFSLYGRSEIMSGYEIHMGATVQIDGSLASPLNKLEDGNTDGFMVSPTCMGTYIHGILDNQPFIDFLLEPHIQKTKSLETFDYHKFKEQQYDKLAEHVRKHLNIPLVYDILTRDYD